MSAEPRSGSGGARDSGFDSLPFGAPVLKPNLDLNLAQTKIVSDLRPLRQAQILFRVEFFFQLEELFTRESGAATARFARAAAGAVAARVA